MHSEAWNEGYDSHKRGDTKAANPYSPFTHMIEWLDWNAGWNALKELKNGE